VSEPCSSFGAADRKLARSSQIASGCSEILACFVGCLLQLSRRSISLVEPALVQGVRLHAESLQLAGFGGITGSSRQLVEPRTLRVIGSLSQLLDDMNHLVQVGSLTLPQLVVASSTKSNAGSQNARPSGSRSHE